MSTRSTPTPSRRELLRRAALGASAVGVGLPALGVAAEGARLGAHHPARAKRVIYLHMVGAPSHLDLFDPKPELQRRSGELCPDEFFVGKQLAFIRQQPTLLGTPSGERKFAFARCGESGTPLSNLLPRLQGVADRLCVVRTLHTEEFNHAPAQLFQLTGFGRFGRPSIGSWINYGLSTENAKLPGFVVLITGNVLGAGNSAWGSGFLPTTHQGVEFRSAGEPVLFLSNPTGLARAERRGDVDVLQELNQLRLGEVGDPEIATRMAQYELAHQMQASVPELLDTSSEPEEVHELYGTQPGRASFANHCLLARRLVERGVRFVQLFDQGWDHHDNVFRGLPNKAAQVDQPIAALLVDLERRGLLDETLVVWASEFGRTPMAQGNPNAASIGRDHHREAYSIWMAGGGVAAGTTYGETDELGYSIASDPVHVHDLNATILHLLGIDHERLTWRHQGRRFRLTDVHGRVVRGLLG